MEQYCTEGKPKDCIHLQQAQEERNRYKEFYDDTLIERDVAIERAEAAERDAEGQRALAEEFVRLVHEGKIYHMGEDGSGLYFRRTAELERLLAEAQEEES